MLKAVFKSITNETLKRKVLQHVEILYFIYLSLVNCCTSSKKNLHMLWSYDWKLTNIYFAFKIICTFWKVLTRFVDLKSIITERLDESPYYTCNCSIREFKHLFLCYTASCMISFHYSFIGRDMFSKQIVKNTFNSKLILLICYPTSIP